MEQQSSILSEQELHLLASHATPQQANRFRVYSYLHSDLHDINFVGSTLHIAYSIEQLIVMLRTSPRGIAVILPSTIQASAEPKQCFTELVSLLAQRADIGVFWLGPPSSIETNLVTVTHCADVTQLQQQVNQWKCYIENLFSDWLETYSVSFICADQQQRKQHQGALNAIGLSKISYLTAQAALITPIKQALLIIDLETPDLHLINLLKQLSNAQHFPIILAYGRLPENVCHATYTFIENSGFPMLASLGEVPDKAQWQTLLSALFCKVYLQHWGNEVRPEVNTYKLYELDTLSVVSYFCAPGISKNQIQVLPKTDNIRHIIHAQSLNDWFPEGVKREMRLQLASELNCAPYQLDVCIEDPEKILRTSAFFAGLVMARLAKTKVYWRIEDENNLLTDVLKNFPISDIILSESLSHHLITESSERLRDFIEQAQLAQVNIVASLPPSNHSKEALAWYGIDLVLSAD